MLHHDDESGNSSLYDFIFRHPQLQSVKCEIGSNHPTELVTRLMHCLFDSCPHLRSLEIDVKKCLRYSWFTDGFDPAVYGKLKRSKLESLSLNFIMEIDPADAFDGFINDTLKRLTFLPNYDINADWSVGWQSMFVLLRSFSNLTHLSFKYCHFMDDPALQCIFEHQVITSIHDNLPM